MQRVKMKDFIHEVHLSPNNIRYYIDTGQLPVGIKVIGRSGKPRYLLFREMIEECRENGKIQQMEERRNVYS